MSGNAIPDSDYNSLSGSVTIPDGSATATINVTPIDDTLVESEETVVVTLSTNPDYVIGSPSSDTVTILSDDPNAIIIIPDEGTLGTELTITGSGFGAKKGKVLIGGVGTQIAKRGWSNSMITCTVSKVMPPGETYDVTIMIQPYKIISPVTIPGGFTVMNPELDPLPIDHGTPGKELRITGKFLSTKKGKVYVEYQKNGQIKKKNCKVTYWFMDASTGESEIRFLVPKGLDPETYRLWVTNKVGSATKTLTVDPWP